MALSGRHLLIISCSKTKNSQLRNNEEITLPAITGYDGKIFLTLRKAFREGLGLNVDVLIISAKYGLLRATDEISYYEERMTKQKAGELRDRVLSKLKLIVTNGGNYRKIFVVLLGIFIGILHFIIGPNYSGSFKLLVHLPTLARCTIYSN